MRRVFDNESLLTPDKPLIDAVDTLCRVGREALSNLDSGKTPAADWKQNSLTAIDPYVNHRVGDFLIQIAPGVQQLVQAVPAGQAQ